MLTASGKQGHWGQGSGMMKHRVMTTMPTVAINATSLLRRSQGSRQRDWGVSSYKIHVKNNVAWHIVSDKCCCLVAKLCPTLQPDGLQPDRLLSPQDFPGKNTELGCHFLLHGVFLTQGSNPHLLYQQADSLPRSHRGSPGTRQLVPFFFFF